MKKLSPILQAVTQPVAKEKILNNMPNCFGDFESTFVVLDCTK